LRKSQVSSGLFEGDPTAYIEISQMVKDPIIPSLRSTPRRASFRERWGAAVDNPGVGGCWEAFSGAKKGRITGNGQQRNSATAEAPLTSSRVDRIRTPAPARRPDGRWIYLHWERPFRSRAPRTGAIRGGSAGRGLPKRNVRFLNACRRSGPSVVRQLCVVCWPLPVTTCKHRRPSLQTSRFAAQI